MINFHDTIKKDIREHNLKWPKIPDSIIIELFIRGRKLNISLAFIMHPYCKLPKHVRLNTMHFLL